jgi:phospholipase C
MVAELMKNICFLSTNRWKRRPSFLLFASLIIVAAALAMPGRALAMCPLSQTNPSVTVCTPTPYSIVNITPAHVVAGTTDSNPVTTMQIYVDNKLVYQVHANSVDAYIPLTVGNHLLTVQAWDTTGTTFKTNVSISETPPCALNSANQSVTICTPGHAATVSLPVHLVAGFTDSNPLPTMLVFVNGSQVYQTSSGKLDVYLKNLAAGGHTVTVQAQDNTGAVFKTSIPITVTSNAGLSNIRHIIFFVQENRSFDDYFGMLGQYRASKGLPNNIDGVPLNATLYNTQGQPVHPYHYQTVCTENLSPFWNESHVDVDGGLMDKFMKTSTSVPSTIDPTGTRAMGYYDQTELPYYYELATQFGTSDRFFSPVESNTNANRMYLFAATSFGHIRPDTPPSGGWTQPTIFDHLDQAGVSWRYYYQDNGTYLPQWSTYQRDAAKMKPILNWYSDIKNESTLPSVIFIERGGPSGLDEHPGVNIQVGAANTAKILNALMASPSWGSSVFILTYDEGGGLYDHVVPASQIKPDSIAPMLQSGDQHGDFANSGFRMPLIVVSPWVKPNYVSHTWRDLTSILRLIEVRFSVASLSARDATADDMMEFFDFSSPHWLTPPPLPVQPTDGTCNYNLEKAPGY